MISCISLLSFSFIFRITDELWNIKSALYLYSTQRRATVTRTIGTSPSSGRYAKYLISIFYMTSFSDFSSPTDIAFIKNLFLKVFEIKNFDGILQSYTTPLNCGQHCIGKMAADEYILSFLFATQLGFRQTNNAEQQNKQ